MNKIKGGIGSKHMTFYKSILLQWDGNFRKIEKKGGRKGRTERKKKRREQGRTEGRKTRNVLPLIVFKILL